MKNKSCCKQMSEHLNLPNESDVLIDYNLIFDEYGLKIPGDNFSYLVINFCPWCGVEAGVC